jgi:hypothetical protein
VAAVFSKNPEATDLLIRFEEEVMGRKYFPLFFQVLDQNGKPLYTSAGFRGIGYETKDQVLVNARNGKETQERIRPAGRRTPYRIISTPVYRNGKLTEIIQIGTHLHYVRKSLSVFKSNILAAVPIILIWGHWEVGFCQRSLSPIGSLPRKRNTLRIRIQ